MLMLFLKFNLSLHPPNIGIKCFFSCVLYRGVADFEYFNILGKTIKKHDFDNISMSHHEFIMQGGTPKNLFFELRSYTVYF